MTTSVNVVHSATEAGEVARRHARAGEADGVLHREVLDALAAADLLRLAVPRQFGGPEADPVSYVDAIADVSVGDAAAGWYSAVSSTTSVLAWYLPEDAIREIYPNGSSLTGSSFAPTGAGRWVDDNLVADSGRWPWGSTGAQADWMAAGFVVDGVLQIGFVPRGDFEPLENWDAVGLRASASADFAIRPGVAIPRHRVLEFGAGFIPNGSADLTRFPGFVYIAAAYAAVAVGNARGSLDELAELAATKVPTGSKAPLAESEVFQYRLAEIHAKLGAATAYLRSSLAQLWETTVAGDEPTTEQRAAARLAISHSASEATAVAASAYSLAGGSSVHVASPLQKRLRDAHVAAQHLLVSDRFFGLFGRQQLGYPLDAETLVTL
ncbi:acyl-CoA dehydrogenase family protein [Rhodococcus zopfii]|uniref:acyl-CoA dehydrogenase family protein n=1 Tax=Rhodococcus zopfii TaxID=43772 RepID=UPI0009329A0A|nr:acyl-CoA dehydrogenase family protein [Rhodococcus zopfii]